MNALKGFSKRWPFELALGVMCALAGLSLAWLDAPARMLLGGVLLFVTVRAVSSGVYVRRQSARAAQVLAEETELLRLVHTVCALAESEPQPDTILVHDPVIAAKLHELNDAHAKDNTARVEALGDEALALHFGGHASMEEWIDGALNAGSGFPDE